MKTLDERINFILREIELVNEKNKGDEYEKLFQEVLDKYGVDDPEELDSKEQKKFFKEVEKLWKERK